MDDEQEFVLLNMERNRLADELLAWSKETLHAWEDHNYRRLLEGPHSKIPEKRADLRHCSAGLEMASHAVRRGEMPMRNNGKRAGEDFR